MAFPAGLTNGQTTVINGVAYVFSATDNAWTRVATPFGDLAINGNLSANNATFTGNVSASGNVIAGNVYLSTLSWANGTPISLAGTYSNVNVEAYFGANIGTLYQGDILTQANIGTLYLGNISTQANIGSYQTYANTNITELQANIGAFYNYANIKIGTNADGNLVVNSTTENTNATSGALVVKGGAAIAGNLFVGGNLNIGGNTYVINSTIENQVTGNLIIGSPITFPAINANIQYGGNQNSYLQLLVQNANSGTAASTDFVASADNAGSDTDTYIDMGINSSTYNQPGYTATYPNDGYLYVQGNTTTGGGNLILATMTDRDIIFTTGGQNTNNEVMRITSGNVVQVTNSQTSTSTTTGALVVAGGIGVGGNLFVGGNIDVTSGYITNLADPLASQDAATKNYVDSQISGFSTTTISAGSAYVTAVDDGGFGNVDISGNIAVSGNANIAGKIFGDKFYTTNGLYWAGNGVAFSSGGGASTLDDLTDVILDTPLNGQVLKYNGSSWVNGTITSGGGSGITYTADTVPPVSPNVADQWYNTTTDTLYEYLDNGVSQYWVDVQTSIIAANASTSLTDAIQANIGEYQTYANANLGTATNNITNLVTQANANTAAYLTTYTGNVSTGNLNVGNYSTLYIATGSTSNKSALTIAGNVYGRGGVGYLDAFQLTNNYSAATNPSKYMRVGPAGTFEIINNAYTQNIFSLTDDGAISIPGQLFVGGAQTTNGPAFAAYAAAVLQTITSGSQQKVLFQTEEYDTNNCYTNSRFTPTVAGYYQLNAEVRLDGASGTGEMMIILYKNGGEYKRGTNQSGTQIASNFWAMQVSSIAYANGTGDYFEIYVQQGSGSSVTVTAVNNQAITWFNGCMIRGA